MAARIKVCKCSGCGANYNGSQYENCPYCGTQRIITTEIKTDDQPEIENIESDEKHAIDDRQTKTAAMFKTEAMRRMDSNTSMPAASVQATPIQPPPVQTPPVQTPPVQASSVQSVSPPSNDLTNRVQTIGKTTAKFISSSGTYPVVGWLVAVKGVYYGQSFPLRSGINRVSRSDSAEVALLRDQSVSSECVVKIVFDSKTSDFYALPGDSSSLCYVNGSSLLERQKLEGMEELEMGDSEANKFVFVPLCGSQFRWSDHKQ